MIAQSGSASGLGPEGRGFESLSPEDFRGRSLICGFFFKRGMRTREVGLNIEDSMSSFAKQRAELSECRDELS